MFNETPGFLGGVNFEFGTIRGRSEKLSDRRWVTCERGPCAFKRINEAIKRWVVQIDRVQWFSDTIQCGAASISLLCAATLIEDHNMSFPFICEEFLGLLL